MEEAAPLDPALFVQFEAEVTRVGVNLAEFARKLQASVPAHADPHAEATTAPQVGIDIVHALAHLRTLPDGAGTDASLAAWVRPGAPPSAA
jgi:hypothetical protein